MLVVALSGRAIAQSLARAGYKAAVADAFADADTRRFASVVIRLEVDEGFRFRTREGAKTIAAQAPADRYANLLYGSGFEAQPGFLKTIARGRRLFGNRPEAIGRVKDPRSFFSLLSELGIPFPEIRYSRPRKPRGWLAKPIGESGGRGVQHADEYRGKDGYFQRFMPGIACSALILANGHRSRVLGWNRMFTEAIGKAPLLYAGAVNRADIPAGLRRRVSGDIQKLVSALELRGLIGLDFIFHGGEAYWLEINPRPPATFELHEGRESLIAWHLRACGGELPRKRITTKEVRAVKIVYATNRRAVPADRVWPVWCSDRPIQGTLIEPGVPVCSVHARGSKLPAVEKLLSARVARIGGQLPSECRTDVRSRFP